MGSRRESRAFRKGFMLGGLAGAGATLWNAPQSGERTREQIMESIEGVLFKLLDMPEQMTGVRPIPAPDSPAIDKVVETPVGVRDSGIPLAPGTDIVIGGPRPSEMSR